MKIELICVGKGVGGWLAEGITSYRDRLAHYVDFTLHEVVLPSRMASLSPKQLKEAEGKLLLKRVTDVDHLVLLDERGRQFDSVGLSHYLQQHLNRSTRRMAFVVGGAYGFSDEVYKACHDKLSLSKMTLPHQLVRLFFTEQLYRAYTIIKGESYHHG